MGAILLMMTIGGLIIAAILLAISYWKKIAWLKNFVTGGATVWLVFYALIFLVSSIFSEEKTLAVNEPKEFCGFYLDCHLHAAVGDVKRTKTFGGKTANGEFYIVKIKVSSDAKRESLNLITPNFEIVDADGNRFGRDASLEKPEPVWEQKVPAGGSFEKEVIFDLPTEIKNPRLDVREGYGIDHAIEAILVGDEDSFLHKRTYFKLEEQSQTASVK
jgi:hypothetical protein